MSLAESLGDVYRKVKAYIIMLRHRFSRPKELDWITPSLAIGSDVRDIGYLKAHNINAVVGLQAEHNDDEKKLKDLGLNYLYIPIKDGHPPEQAQIRKMVDWVNGQVAGGHRIYMHCAAGVGRAPTMAMAYLVSIGFTSEEAYTQIKRKHRDTDPSPKQLAAVREYEVATSPKDVLGLGKPNLLSSERGPPDGRA